MAVTTTMTTAMMDISQFEFLIVLLLEGASNGSTHRSRVVGRLSLSSLLTFAFGVGVCGR